MSETDDAVGQDGSRTVPFAIGRFIRQAFRIETYLLKEAL